MFQLIIDIIEQHQALVQIVFAAIALILSYITLKQKDDINALKEISKKLEAQSSNQQVHINLLTQDYIQRQPAHFSVKSFKQIDTTASVLEVVIINNGKTLYLEDENWIYEADPSKFKSTRYPNSYESRLGTSMVDTFTDKPEGWNPNKFMLYPIKISPYEKIKVKFRYKADTSQKGTASGLNVTLRFKDINGDCFEQQMLGAYYNEIYCGPVYKINVQ